MEEELNHLRKKVRQQKIIIKVLSDRLYEKDNDKIIIDSDQEDRLYRSLNEDKEQQKKQIIAKKSEIKYRQNFTLVEFVEYLQSLDLIGKLIEESSRAVIFKFRNIQLKEIRIYTEINYKGVYRYFIKNINSLPFETTFTLIFILRENNKINIFTDLILFLRDRENMMNYLILIFYDEFKLCTGIFNDILAEVIADILHKNKFNAIEWEDKIFNMKKLIRIFTAENKISPVKFSYEEFIKKIIENKTEFSGTINDELKENGRALLLISQYCNFDEFYEYFFSALMKKFQKRKRPDLLYYIAVLIFAMRTFDFTKQYDSAVNILLIESRNQNIELSYSAHLLLIILNILPFKKEFKISPLF